MFNKRGALSKVELSKEQPSKIRYCFKLSECVCPINTRTVHTQRERERE